MQSFVFGGNTGVSYDSLQKRRQIAQSLMQQKEAPKYAITGAADAAQSIVGALLDRKLEGQEKEMREGFNADFANALGGGSFGSTGGLPAAEGMQGYRDAIASIESAGSGDYKAVGPTHSKLGRALGRYQIMEANIGPWSREALGREVSADEFLANPALQDAIFDHKFGGYVQQFGPEGAAQAWFAGPGGVGKMGRKDSLGTSVADYTQKFSNALGGSGVKQVASQANMAQLIALADNPMATPGQKAVVQAILNQQLQARDPMHQLQMQNLQSQIDARNAKAAGGNVDLPSAVIEAQWRAEQAGLKPGTPEYQEFILNGGGDPATFRALDMQAKAAGLEEGTPEYQNFMATRGAGNQAYARGIGANQADIETGGAAAQVVAEGQARGKTTGVAEAQSAIDAPVAVRTAEETIRLLDKVINDPALPDLVGKIQGRIEPGGMLGMTLSQEALNLYPTIEQLQGRAFLQAFDGLKGGGQITEREGQAATAAESRLQQRYVDEETYLETLRDMRRIADNGRRRALGETVDEYVPAWVEQEGAAQEASAPQSEAQTELSGFEAFAANPDAQRAAEQYGVSLEEMWAIKQRGTSR